MTILALILAGIAFAYTLGNAIILIRALFTGRHGSLVPLLGGISGSLALLACPIPGAWRWAWLPPLLDPGCSWTALLIGHAALSGRLRPPKDSGA